MSLKIALISRDNGVGLSLDVELLTDLFLSAGHDVEFYDWKTPSMPRVDVAFHLELISKDLAQCAAKNILIPNLEWYPAEWMKFLSAFDQVWAKGWYAYRFCRQRGARNVELVGFLGRDRYDPKVQRELTCLHVKGRSAMKGTAEVLEAWRSNPDLPPLTVVSKDPLNVPDNVTVMVAPSDCELDRLMNEAQIHLCPSLAEGWGHYITEALSVEAVVVTTDASPMNEHVRPEWGYLLGVSQTRMHHQALQTFTTPEMITEAVSRAVALGPVKLREIGRKGRTHFLKRNAEFTETALKLVEQ